MRALVELIIAGLFMLTVLSLLMAFGIIGKKKEVEGKPILKTVKKED